MGKPNHVAHVRSPSWADKWLGANFIHMPQWPTSNLISNNIIKITFTWNLSPLPNKGTSVLDRNTSIRSTSWEVNYIDDPTWGFYQQQPPPWGDGNYAFAPSPELSLRASPTHPLFHLLLSISLLWKMKKWHEVSHQSSTIEGLMRHFLLLFILYKR